jgi:hypothetical protein
MKKNPVLSALSILLRNTGKSLQILKYGLIENGWLRMTDLDHELKVFVGDQSQKPVLADVGLLIKTGDLPAAIGAAQSMEAEEFPKEIMEEHPETSISPRVLDGLIELLPATATDDSRGCLKMVFVSRKRKEAVATDGHVLLIKKLPGAPKEGFLIDPISLRIAGCFEGNVMDLTIRHRVEVRGADRNISTHAADFITLSGNGWQLISRVPPAKEYPMYWKAIPDRSKAISVLWDKGLIAEVGTFLEKANPFTNSKSHMVYFTVKEGIVRNRDLSYLKSTAFSRDILALKPEQVIGIDAEILQTVLRFIQDRAVAVTVGDQMINAVVFQGEECLGLVMPLRTAESGSGGITRTALMQDNNGVGEMRKAA